MFVLCGIGRETFEEKYKTRKSAEKHLKDFVKWFKKEYEVNEEYSDELDEEDDFFRWGVTCAKDYQILYIYEEPKTSIEEIEVLLQKAEYGLEQYSFELMSTGACSYYLDKVREVLERMKNETA